MKTRNISEIVSKLNADTEKITTLHFHEDGGEIIACVKRIRSDDKKCTDAQFMYIGAITNINYKIASTVLNASKGAIAAIIEASFKYQDVNFHIESMKASRRRQA